MKKNEKEKKEKKGKEKYWILFINLFVIKREKEIVLIVFSIMMMVEHNTTHTKQTNNPYFTLSE